MCDVGDVLTKVFAPVIGFKDDIGNALGRAFTKPGTGGDEARAQMALDAAKQSQRDTQAQMADALKAQKDAADVQAAAGATADAQMQDELRKRRARASDPGAIAQFFTAGATATPNTTATRTLFGS